PLSHTDHLPNDPAHRLPEVLSDHRPAAHHGGVAAVRVRDYALLAAGAGRVIVLAAARTPASHG
ncbi:hypothetical protein, partial [Bordetella bronchiseptica]|uniref:hypothetical protein n=1 Tax=Bordetella bronchiseptica TaxID=518 RepID=UPI003EDB81BE